VLTLDEPELQSVDGHAAWPAVWATGDLQPIEHLYMAVRAWCERPLHGQMAGDPDPLYRTHGDPRD